MKITINAARIAEGFAALQRAAKPVWPRGRVRGFISHPKGNGKATAARAEQAGADAHIVELDETVTATWIDPVWGEHPLPDAGAGFFVCGDHAGPADKQLPEPWVALAPGVWSAPAGTVPPGADEEEQAWVNDMAQEFGAAADRHREGRRYFLNALTTAQDTDPVEDMRAWMNRYEELVGRRVTRIEAGRDAYAAIQAAAEPKPQRGWPKDNLSAVGTLAGLTSVPVTARDDLPPTRWRAVDGRTGEVIDEGTAGNTVDDYQRVVDDALDEFAARIGMPRNLLG